MPSPGCLAVLLLCRTSVLGHTRTGAFWEKLSQTLKETIKWSVCVNMLLFSVFVCRMDSFFLAEMFKYLYLLFSEKNQLPINIDDYIFTTEAHLLPVSLSTTQASVKTNVTVNRLSLAQSEVLFSNLYLKIGFVTDDERYLDCCKCACILLCILF